MRSQQRISRGKRVWTYAVRGAFIIGATALAWFHLPAAIIAICATLLVALHTKAGMLIELSFGPLRAKLERDLSEAEQLVQKLRSFAALQAGTIISAATRTGRWADAADDWQYVNLRRTEEALRHMGVSEEELKAARADLVNMTVRDLGNSALGQTYVPTKLGQEAVSEWQELKRTGRQAIPDEVEAYLRKWDALTPDREIRITDMRWVLEHDDIRDREQFLRAHAPIEWDQS